MGSTEHEVTGPSVRPLLLVLGLFLGGVAAALGTAGPATSPYLTPTKAAPAPRHELRPAVLIAQIERRQP